VIKNINCRRHERYKMSEKDIHSVLCDSKIDMFCFDADDTLWYDYKYFNGLKKAFNSIIINHGLDKAEADIIVKFNLKKYSKGEKGFADALLRTALDLRINTDEIKVLEMAIEAFLKHPIEFLPYSYISLLKLNCHNKILITQGNRKEQERKIAMTRIRGFFNRILIVEKKDPGTYKDIFKDLNIRGERVLMFGNSIKNDIIPAIYNSANAIWLNHSMNVLGRDDTLPANAYQVNGWNEIYKIISNY